MQTFLPYPDFKKSAKALDNRRLGKQRVEVLQIYRALRGETAGWANHPATRMWRGHATTLLDYGIAMCDEWIRRGFRDTTRAKLLDYRMSDPEQLGYPDWFGREDFHRAHQSNLVRKAPEHYTFIFGDIEPMEYIWPK